MVFFMVVSLKIVVLKSCEVMKMWFKNLKSNAVGIAPTTFAHVEDEDNTKNSAPNHQNVEA